MVRSSVRRSLSIALCVLAMLVASPSIEARVLEPLMGGWERIFTITWEPAEYRGRPAVAGRVTNISPYTVTNIRVLVDSLDSAGQLLAQRIAYVPGDLPGWGYAYFEVPVAQAAPAYRVRVFSFDWVLGDDFGHRRRDRFR